MHKYNSQPEVIITRYGEYFLENDEEYLEELSFLYGIEREDILSLLDYGFGVFDIEEILCCPEIFQNYIRTK